jgi:hypothetical protein
MPGLLEFQFQHLALIPAAAIEISPALSLKILKRRKDVLLSTKLHKESK